MTIKSRRHEIVMQLLKESLGDSIKICSVTQEKATVVCRGVEINFSVNKLPPKPTFNDVFIAIDRAYAQRTKKRNMKEVNIRTLRRIKVGLVCLWNEPFVDERAGGPVYALEAMGRNLTRFKDLTRVEVDYVFISEKKKSKSWHEDFRPINPNRALEELSTFDFLIFSTAGTTHDKKEGPVWNDWLEHLEVPFGVQLHDEAEANLLPHRNLFFEHPYCCLLLPITEETLDILVPEEIELPYVVYPGFTIPTYHVPRKLIPTKSIVTTCRMTSRKRIVELIELAPQLHDLGFTIDIYGADVTWQYKNTLKAMEDETWTYHGTFDKKDLPKIFEGKAFHYNAVAFKKRSNFVPRIEIATWEAVQYGLCPILADQTAPDWVTEDMAVFVDPFDMEDLPEVLNDVYNYSGLLNENFRKAMRYNPDMNERTEELVDLMLMLTE